MTAITKLNSFYDSHPYMISFIISVLITVYAFFYTDSPVHESTTDSVDQLQFVNIEEMQAPKRVVKKEVTTDETAEPTEEQVERAEGSSEVDDTVDLAFYPNVAPPRLISRLKKIYPQEAKSREIEARTLVQLTIAPDGKVIRARMLRARLSKEVPADQKQQLLAAFRKAVKKTFTGAKYSPPVIDGRRVPVNMEIEYNFTLQN